MGSFGALLRDGREHAGLTQEELAERAGVSVRTIRNLEADKVASPRLSSLRSLADAIGTDRVPFILAARHRAPPESAPAAGRLPTRLTSLVGRATDVKAITELVDACGPRLVTLSGVAGVGKTRLALAVAERLTASQRSVWWVELANTPTIEQALATIAETVGASAADHDAIAQAVRGTRAVVVIDNVEHLGEMPSLLGESLGAASDLTVVATSRAPVGLDGEHEYPVGPLDVPPLDHPSGDRRDVDMGALAETDAAVLFVDRVRACDPTFELTAATASQVAEVCSLLGGLPLAIELAARQWRVRGPEGLIAVLRDDPLRLADVTGARRHDHESVEHALRASYDLLDDDAQRVLHALSVFRGGWTLDAATAVVCPDQATVVAHHDRLLSHGLIDTRDVEADDTTAPRRFSMLPIVQAFAAGRADELGISQEIARRHADRFVAWASAFDLIEKGADRSTLGAFDAERDNLRAALTWLTEHDASGGLTLALAVSTYWTRRGREDEGFARFEAVLERVGDHPARAFASMVAAGFAHFHGHHDRAAALAGDSLEASRQDEDPTGLVQALGTLGMIQVTTVPAQAVGTLREASDLASEIGYERGEQWALSNLAEAYLQIGRLDSVYETVDRLSAMDDKRSSSQPQHRMLVAEALRLGGDAIAASAVMGDAEDAHRQADSVEFDVHWLAQRAIAAAATGDLDAADEFAAASMDRHLQGSSRRLRHEVWLAMGEVALARGEREEASDWFRSAAGDGGGDSPPMRRVEILVALASATDDDAEADEAIAEAETMSSELDISLPPAIEQRLDAAQRRLA